jgi:uncharacterized surface protein with fasciclin (FAS1) repeats
LQQRHTARTRNCNQQQAMDARFRFPTAEEEHSMTHSIRRKKQLLSFGISALLFGAASTAANANMCMKKHYYGHHAYPTPLHAPGMHRYPAPIPYAYPAHRHDSHARVQASAGGAADYKQQPGAEVAPEAPDTAARDRNILETAAAAGNFNTLIKAVLTADLYDTLRDGGPFTVFAPTDAAFEKLPAGTLDDLLADKGRLVSVLTYHVVPGRLTAADILQQRELQTVQGQNLSIGSLSVVNADIETSNGIVHVIDSVLIPGS